MTSYFYITDVDADSVPHVMIKNSRDHQPLNMLLSSNLQANDAVYNYAETETGIAILFKGSVFLS
ncbi:hypothetical protein NIES4074_41670 [Cylindrospermum sp. NIES-4074]|nr:hypothetical protein NIES4074_41670 [Cylindrospermum sp. NIES-4074]